MRPAPPTPYVTPRLMPTGPARMLKSLVMIALLFACAACTPSHLLADRLGQMLASSGTVFAADDDPELIRDAMPFSLKLIDGALAQNPRHPELLAAAARSYTQYAYAFLQMEADPLESDRLSAAIALRARARGLYRRARGYGQRGLELSLPDFRKRLQSAPQDTLALLGRAELPLLYWTAAAWAAEIALTTGSSELIADLPLVAAMLERALALDEGFEDAATHSLMIPLRKM